MKGYRIKTVSRVTGLSPELLRAWERRYGVVHPTRTSGGYREYSEEDVARLRLLRSLTSRGYAIGELAPMAPGELERLSREERARGEEATGGADPGAIATRRSVVVDHLLGLAVEHDGLGLRRALRRSLVVLPDGELVGSVLLPLLDELTRRAGRHERDRAALQLAVAEVRGFTGALGVELPADARLGLVASSADEAQGALLLRCQLSLLAAGWQAVCVAPGGDPADHRALAAELRPAGVVLAFESPVQTRGFAELLDGWRSVLSGRGRLIVVGEAVDLLAGLLADRGAQFVADVAELPRALDSGGPPSRRPTR